VLKLSVNPDQWSAMDPLDAVNDPDGTAGMPAGVAAAWGLRARPTKGPKPGLSLDEIVAAAVKIAETDGLPAVSMPRIAASLGAGAMSLYRYVGSKDELLTLMAEVVYSEAPAPNDPATGWRQGLSRWAWQLHDVTLRHSWVVRMPVSGPPATPNQLVWMENGLAALRDSGLAESEKISLLILLTGFIRSEVITSVDTRAAYAMAGATEEEASVAYGRLLMRLITPERFPALTASITAGVSEKGTTAQVRFAFGLDRLLDGIQVLVNSRR
jgi:AcrR family transcriptional regulator